MNADRFEEVAVLFARVRALAPAKRAALLGEVCADDPELRREVESLLAERESPIRGRETASLRADLGRLAADSVRGAEPDRIGRYRIIRTIGSGGMGTVYEAEQKSPRRTVALKVINAGLASPQALRRFEYESEVLGRLKHSGIAQVFESGTFDRGFGAQPFFAMELVEGTTLTEHADAHDLDHRQRLQLLTLVCEAAHHAHLRGIIHRDLKPANILVTEERSTATDFDGSGTGRLTAGQPKILDFGVARATDGDVASATMQTDVGQLVGTVPYMSPEQAAGEPDAMDTRSDVYAIGVITYELLGGDLPYDVKGKMIHEAVRVIREEDPPKLGTIDRALRGDVETIVAKALEKDPERRYQSAAALAADFVRYLNDEPITARPPDAWYQLRKFARRHRPLVIGAVAVLLALVIGVAGIGIALQHARQEARTAKQVSNALAQLFDLSDLFEVDDPREASGRTIRPREIIDRGAARLAADLAGQEEVEATLSRSLGTAYATLEHFDEAIPLLERSLALRRELDGDDDESVTAALLDLALAHHGNRDYNAAEPLFRDVLRRELDRYGERDPRVASAISDLATLLHDRGHYEDAERMHREVLALREEILPPGHESIDGSLNMLGRSLQMQRRFDEAETCLLRVLAMREQRFGAVHLDVASALYNLGAVYKESGDRERAEPILRRSLEIRQELLGREHPLVATGLDMLGRLLRARGEIAEAESLHREALAIKRRTLPEGHTSIANTINNLALVVSIVEGRRDEAIELIRESIRIYRDAGDGENPNVGTALHNLGLALRSAGDLEGAATVFQESVDLHTLVRGPTNRRTLTDLRNLAGVRTRLGDDRGATPLLRTLLERRLESEGPDARRTAEARCDLGACLARLGKRPEAEGLLLEGHRGLVAAVGEGDPETRRAIETLVELYRAAGDQPAARRWAARLGPESGEAARSER